MISHVIRNYKSLLFLICTCKASKPKQRVTRTVVGRSVTNYNNTWAKLYFNMKLLLRFPFIMFEWSPFSSCFPLYTLQRPCTMLLELQFSAVLWLCTVSSFQYYKERTYDDVIYLFIKLNNLWITEEYKLFQFYIISN